MIQYRFKTNNKMFKVINKYTPPGKLFTVDKYTGEQWIKINNDEHTPEFKDRVTMLCELLECEDTLKITACKNDNNFNLLYFDDRASLFE